MSKATRLLSTSAYGGVEYGNQLIDHFGTIVPPSPEQTARARRYVAGMATDVEDAKVLLSMLGLWDGPLPTVVQEAAHDLLRGRP